VPRGLRTIGDFLQKFANDWAFNLCTLLAYNFLTAIFPLFLGILALGAFVLPVAQLRDLATSLTNALPSGVTSPTGLNINLYSMLVGFHKASKLTAIISFGGFVWTGSNLFSSMENCFSIIFRTGGRDVVPQKLMAIGMVFLFAALAPLAVVAATISGFFPNIAAALGHMPDNGVLLAAGGYLLGAVVSFLLFFLIYAVVPNRRMHPREVWRGALVAAILFEIVNIAFPFYAGRFMTHAWFGQALLVFGILAFWFWIVSLVFILGAELNSFLALQQRALPADVAGLVHTAAQRAVAAQALPGVDRLPASAPKPTSPALWRRIVRYRGPRRRVPESRLTDTNPTG
jgi:membrane protein